MDGQVEGRLGLVWCATRLIYLESGTGFKLGSAQIGFRLYTITCWPHSSCPILDWAVSTELIFFREQTEIPFSLPPWYWQRSFCLPQHQHCFIIDFPGLWWRQIHLHGFLPAKTMPCLFIWNQVKQLISVSFAFPFKLKHFWQYRQSNIPIPAQCGSLKISWIHLSARYSK